MAEYTHTHTHTAAKDLGLHDHHSLDCVSTSTLPFSALASTSMFLKLGETQCPKRPTFCTGVSPSHPPFQKLWNQSLRVSDSGRFHNVGLRGIPVQLMEEGQRISAF